MSFVWAISTHSLRFYSSEIHRSIPKMSDFTTSAADQEHVDSLKRQLAEKSVNATGTLGAIPDVAIDTGVYKYVLIKVHDPNSGQEKYLVRGRLNAPYHADVADPVCTDLQRKGFNVDVTGGGRINRNDKEKSILVYGYSYGFGRADHSISADLCRQAYPEYAVEWSNEGY